MQLKFRFKSMAPRGDSLVEVLLAITVLSTVIALSWLIVNRSLQISLVARQRVVMVNALKEQAEVIKALYASDETRSVIAGTGSASPVITSVTNQAEVATDPCNARKTGDTFAPVQSFHFSSSAEPVVGGKQNIGGYPGSALWVQRRHNSGNQYVDFYIQACWSTVGSINPTDSSQLIVRLNR